MTEIQLKPMLHVYDWFELEKCFNTFTGRNIRDWYGLIPTLDERQPQDPVPPDSPMVAWAKSKGYDCEVLFDKELPDGSKGVNPEQLEKRVEIHEEYEYHIDTHRHNHYQDFYDYLCDTIYYQVSNGELKSFSPKQLLGERPKWVTEILLEMIKLFEHLGLPDTISIHIWW